MKIALAVGAAHYEEVRKALEDRGIELDDDADFVLTEREPCAAYLPVKDMKTGEKLRLRTDTIIKIESFGKDVEITSDDGKYLTQSRLYQLTYLLNPEKFMRVSNSVIVALDRIVQIQPCLSRKFVLLLSDRSAVDVTRSYYYGFREHFGL